MLVVLSRYLYCSEVTGGGPVTLPTEEQLWEICHKDLTMNVFRNGVYGTFRYLPLLSGCFSRIYWSLYFDLVSGGSIFAGSNIKLLWQERSLIFNWWGMCLTSGKNCPTSVPNFPTKIFTSRSSFYNLISLNFWTLTLIGLNYYLPQTHKLRY